MTLVEVLVATALIALLLGSLLPLLTGGQLTWEHARRRTAMIQNARVAVDSLSHTLRAARDFLVLGPTNIRFTHYFGDGSTPTVEYRLNGATNELEYRWDPQPFQPLAGPFRSMSVTCFGPTGAPADCADPGNVRAVQVGLAVMDPDGVVPDITLTTRAFRQAP